MAFKEVQKIFSATFNFPKRTMRSKRCLQVALNAFLFLDLHAGLGWKTIFTNASHCGAKIPWNMAFREVQIFSAHTSIFQNLLWCRKGASRYPLTLFYFWIFMLDWAGKLYLQTHLTAVRKFPGIWHSGKCKYFQGI